MAATKGCVFVALCALLAACAGAPNRPARSENFDSQKVILVNQWAEAHGARLIWLHYPTRSIAQKDD